MRFRTPVGTRYIIIRRGPSWRPRHALLMALVLALGALIVLAGCSAPPSASSTSATSATVPPSGTAEPTARPPVVYVALGASDAVGVGADNPLTQGYVPRIIARLPAHSQALNLGVSGIMLHQALSAELPQVAPAHPTLITVWLAGNDFSKCAPLAQYRADLDTLLTTLRNQTSAQVFVANLPDMSALPSFQNGAPGAGPCVAGKSTAEIRQLVEQWNAVINSVVAQHGDVLVNLFTSDLVTHPEYVSPADGFHPSSQGYARLADLFWAQITAHHAVPNA